jgi:hypothetical protein
MVPWISVAPSSSSRSRGCGWSSPSAATFCECRPAARILKFAPNWLPARQPLPVVRQPSRLNSSKLPFAVIVRLMSPKLVSLAGAEGSLNVRVAPSKSWRLWNKSPEY